LLRLIEVPEALWGAEWKVRPHKTDSDKKGCSILLSSVVRSLNSADSFRGYATICIGNVGNIRGFPRRATGQAADPVQLLVCEEGFFASDLWIRLGRLAIFDDQIREVWHLKRVRITSVAVSDVEDFAKGFCAVAEAGKVLGKSDGVGLAITKFAAEVIQAGSGGVGTEQQGKTGRGTDSLAAAGHVESCTSKCQAIEIRGLGDGIAIAAKCRFEVIDEQQKNVWAIG
jgi:hypothetical protein